MSLPPSTAGKFRWDRLTYSSALGYALLAGGQSIGFVLGELRHQFRLSGVIAALHGSVFGLTALAAGLCGVSVVDRLGRRTSLVAGAIAISFGIMMFCVGPAWPVTLAGAAIAGLGGALLAVVMPGLISDHHGEHRAAAFAAVNGAVGLTAVTFSLVIGGALALHWSWRPPSLILTALIVLILTAVAWPVAVPEPNRHSNFTLAHLRDRDVCIGWSSGGVRRRIRCGDVRDPTGRAPCGASPRQRRSVRLFHRVGGRRRPVVSGG